MKYTEVKYSRKFNLGNYESEDYSLAAIVDEDDNVQACLAQIKLEVNAAQSGEQQGEENESVEGNTGRGRGKKSGKGSQRAEDADAKEVEDEEIEGEDETESEEGEEEDVDADAGNEDEDSEESEDSPRAGKGKKQSGKPPRSTDGAKAGKAKKFKPKAQVYQRSNETHKEIFSGLLKEVAPTWKSNEKSKAKAKKASTDLEGKEFLNEDGEVVTSFKQLVKKAMK